MKSGDLAIKVATYLEDKNGDLEFGVSVYYEENQIVFLLFSKGILSYYVSLQIKNDVCYIDKLDNTGFAKGLAKDFIKAVLSIVETSTICCFSHPKPSFVFHNTKKNALSPFSLASFWIEVFSKKNCKIFVWSNFFESLQQKYPEITKGHPFKTTSELEYFDDDPKSRIKENLGELSLEKLFTTLLCRNDFVEGCLIYAVENSKDKNNLNMSQKTGPSLTNYLSDLDLSTEEKLRHGSEILIQKFNLEIFDFKFKKKQKSKPIEEPAIILKTKRRKR